MKNKTLLILDVPAILDEAAKTDEELVKAGHF
jgi:hypothetical protein